LLTPIGDDFNSYQTQLSLLSSLFRQLSHLKYSFGYCQFGEKKHHQSSLTHLQSKY
jgi:hypothetical protein